MWIIFSSFGDYIIGEHILVHYGNECKPAKVSI